MKTSTIARLTSTANVPEFLAPVMVFPILWATTPEKFTVSNVLATLSVIILITENLYRFLRAISVLRVSLSCFGRIQKFLELQEGHGTINEPDPRISPHSWDAALATDTTRDKVELQMLPRRTRTGQAHVSIHSGRISLFAPDFVLQDINLQIEPGSVTIIIGPVGSGKTVLLRSLLEDMKLSSGGIRRSSSGTAYCSQHPFLWKDTLRANILGESQWDEQWYNTVIEACALQEVVTRLPTGDVTNVGNHGSVLSGGQQQRVSLARALYSHKPLLILDDPLSGLDRGSQSFVLARLFGPNGVCRTSGLTVVMATSNASHVAFADQIVTLGHHDASVRVSGPEELHGALRTMLPRQNDMSPPAETAPPYSADDEDEDVTKDRGSGDRQLYVQYIRSMGYTCVIVFFLLCSGVVFFTLFPQKWLQLWAASYQNTSIATNNTLYITVYASAAVLALLFLGTGIAYWLIYAVPRSASSLHLDLLQTVMRAPYSWLLMTNTGKTINRFSQDMSLIDVTLPLATLQTVVSSLSCVGSLVFLVLGSVWLAIAIPIILGVLYVLQSVYLRTSRQLRLLDLEAKSPLYTHYGDTIDGLVTIRAYGWQHQYVKRGKELLDRSQSPYYLLYCVQRWLNFVLDMMVAGIATLLVTVSFLLRHKSATNGGSIGIALVNIISFNQALSLLIQNWTMMETSLGAIARISDLIADTPSESRGADETTRPDFSHSAMSVRFSEVSAKPSSESANMILKNVNLHVPAGHKAALVGASGSGKSSILLALTGLLHIESGRIMLNDSDIAAFDRNAVRQQIAVMSQSPPVLPGTVRFNLDPLGLVQDTAIIIAALAKVGLDAKLPTSDGLEAPFAQMNLSTGEMQLFRFAAVLLSNAKLVLLDEVTSNLDAATEREITRLIEEELSDRTIITVAHRLETILDYDQVIVVDGGAVMETGRPRELLKVESSRFGKMYRG
jgi:ATP-binding cassette subfamily C (CFTR/MRP) protein 1